MPGPLYSPDPVARHSPGFRKTPPPRPIYCTHCGRTCANFEGGYATIGNQPVCHPNVEDRPDCYRLVTVYKEVLGSRLHESA
jgi:hypothetical protein